MLITTALRGIETITNAQIAASSGMAKLISSPVIDSQFDILERICSRGRTLFLDKEDSLGVDMFEHLEQEIKRLRLYMEKSMTDNERLELANFRANPSLYMVSDLAYERYMELLEKERDEQ